MGCNNYHVISLLSVPVKVFARFLLMGIRDHLIQTQRWFYAKDINNKRDPLGLRILIDRLQ